MDDPSTSIFYFGDKEPAELPLKHIGGFCAHPPISLDNVRLGCLLEIRHRDGSLYPLHLSKPGTGRVTQRQDDLGLKLQKEEELDTQDTACYPPYS